MTEVDALPPCDDDLIDKMVDGAFSPAELRAAILRLDRVPDGWKRCAAAFLEAQCWRESLRAIGEHSIPGSGGISISRVPAPVRARSAVHRWVRGAMAAAIIGAAFAIGWLGRGAM